VVSGYGSPADALAEENLSASAGATLSPTESISSCWNTSAPSSGIKPCSTASIPRPEARQLTPFAQKRAPLAY